MIGNSETAYFISSTLLLTLTHGALTSRRGNPKSLVGKDRVQVYWVATYGSSPSYHIPVVGYKNSIALFIFPPIHPKLPVSQSTKNCSERLAIHDVLFIML